MRKRNRMLLCSTEELHLIRLLAYGAHPDLNHELCIEIIKKIDTICPEESPHKETQTEEK